MKHRRLGSWAGMSLLALVACGGPKAEGADAAPAADPNAPDAEAEVATDAANAPKTDDCRSFEDLNVDALPDLPESVHTRNFEAVWRTVLEKHYDPTLGCLDWPKIRELYGARVAKAKDADEAFAIMNEMLQTLGQSHLRVVAPYRRTDGATAEDATGPALVPIQIRMIGDDVFVADNEVDGHTVPIPTGAELVQVGTKKVADAVEAGHRVGVREVDKTLHATREVQSLLRCPEGGSKKITFVDPKSDSDASTTTVDVPCQVPEGERVSLGNLRGLPTRVSWRMLEPTSPGGPKVGYLAFNYWMVPMVAKVREGVTELRAAGMEGLILDLRGNPGGVGAMSIPIARLFLQDPADLGTLRMRGMTNEFKVAGDPNAFTGPLCLLVDEGTASTSEIFAVGMRDMGRVSIVGASNSAGLALPSLMETLPDGGLIQFVVGDYHSPKGTAAEGDGVAPDLRVEITRDALVEGRDPVLEAAIERLEGELAAG